MLRVGSDFSGVGAFNQALMRLGIEYKEVFACDMDKYARQTFIHNYGEPKYYPTNVYEREIPTESLDVYMTSPPCQAFSLAGKRLGKDDKRGILFFNSLEFIRQNNPRYFIFENVKGLLSDDGGKTFSEWVNLLGGKSVNNNTVLFPYDDAVDYHLHWKVLNAKEHGVPQNRERVFIVGIRDDVDNNFRWPIEEPLTKRLKDVLEKEVDEKYFLSEKMMEYLTNRSDNFNNGKINYRTEEDYATCITKSSSSIDISDNIIKVGNTHPSGKGMNGNVFDSAGISPTLSTNKGEGIKIKSATSSGYEQATEGDSINFSVPNSETRRGRVGKQVAQTLDTACNQGVMVVKNERTEEAKKKRKENMKKTGKDTGSFSDRQYNLTEQDYSDTILANPNPIKEGLIAEVNDKDVMIGAFRGRNPENPSDTTTGSPTEQRLEINQQGTSNTITSVQKDNVVIYNDKRLNDTIKKNKLPKGEPKAIDTYNQKVQDNAPTLTEPHHNTTRLWDGYKIRRLTPRECFRLMDFPNTFTWPVSDSQAYKQAGNSIVVNVLYKILKNLNLTQTK